MRTLFFFYDLIWKAAIPLLRYHHRLAEGFDERTVQKKLPQADLWIQAASVGEAGLVREILYSLRPPHPMTVLLTANTRQGVEILRDMSENFPLSSSGIRKISVAYSPFDCPSLMEKAVAQARPRLMVLLETEIWPGLLAALKKNAGPVLLLNGRLSSRSLKYYRILPEIWKSLRPSHVLAISPEDTRRFGILFGKEGIATIPNIKFDRIPPESITGEKENPLRPFIPSSRPFIVLGSVRKEEEKDTEQMICRLLSEIPDAVIGLFPRHFHRFHSWEKRLAELHLPCIRRSRIPMDKSITYSSPSTHHSSSRHHSIILWDTFGELAKAYGLADAVFVGGSLAPLGGQNFLEAMICGIVPVIGPFWNDFTWVGQEVFDRGLVRMGKDWQDVADILIQNIQAGEKHPDRRKARKESALRYLSEHRGGTRKACDLMERYLATAPCRRIHAKNKA